ncbi:MAG: hypothetical protein ACRDYB_09690 [Acidimicrobiales bacterium]
MGAVVAVGLYALGGAQPVAPALETWFGGKEPGWDSPPLLARLRRLSSEPNGQVAIESPAPNEPQAVSVIPGQPEAGLAVSALSGAGIVGRRRPDDRDAA